MALCCSVASFPTYLFIFKINKFNKDIIIISNNILLKSLDFILNPNLYLNPEGYGICVVIYPSNNI